MSEEQSMFDRAMWLQSLSYEEYCKLVTVEPTTVVERKDPESLAGALQQWEDSYIGRADTLLTREMARAELMAIKQQWGLGHE